MKDDDLEEFLLLEDLIFPEEKTDDEDEEKHAGSYRGGCLSMVLLIVGATAAIVALPFLN